MFPAVAVTVAIAVRLALWVVLPDRFASDEDNYHRAAMRLLLLGEQDLFWPPVTSWLIALASWLLQTTGIRWVRLCWIAMDIGCLVAVGVLARRIALSVCPGDATRTERMRSVAMLGYAVYLPAVSFAQFATSETPALLLVLTVLVLLTSPGLGWRRLVAAGAVAGTLAVTRTSLLPLVVVLPAALVYWTPRTITARRALLFIAAGATVVGGVVARNAMLGGSATLGHNSDYNLYIGNRDFYAEDLNLFQPMATREQVEFRVQLFRNQVAPPDLTPAEMRQHAFAWIARHPIVFAQRALGRLARVFVPKTDVLELVGGERQAGIFSPRPLALLAIANGQWLLVLVAGSVGLAGLVRLAPLEGRLFAATILGSLPLCLVAISKPRYAFTFEPLLIIAASAMVVAGPTLVRALGRRDRLMLAGCAVFVAWAWIAWGLFSISSRVAMAG